MRHDYLDRFSRIDSPVHRLPAEVKLACAGALLIISVIIPLRDQIATRPWPAAGGPWLVFGSIAFLLVSVAAASRIPLLFLVKRLMFLESFVLGVALLPLLEAGGIAIFARLIVRGTLCLLAVLLLANTTPFAEILRVLRRLRIPAILITLLALLYRYLFVFVDEAERMDRARASRTFLEGRRRLWRARAGVIGQLFVRSTIRAERIYAAMCARGWKS